MKDYQTLIERALAHIRKQQFPDGGFGSISAFAAEDFSAGMPYRTTFFTANILGCLHHIPGRTADMQTAATNFLLAQKSERWSFNYWARDAKEHATLPYPDDLDDTFAALAALARHDTTLIDGHAFSSIAKILTAQEVAVGGPYRTWLVGADAPPAWRDVDLVANSTIGYFLALVNVRLPRLRHFVDSAVQERRIESPYYPGIFHVGYFLSRFYRCAGDIKSDGCSRETLANIITDRLLQCDGKNATTLERAMAISSLIDLGHAEMISPSMVDLLASQLARDGFLPYAFCIDPAREGRRCHAGASALTAAFCAEALAKYSAAGSSIPSATDDLHDHIRSLARISCREAGPELRTAAIAQIEKTTDQKITALAYEFREILYRNGKIVSQDITEALSLANLYGWMAYDIYDDALDDEGGASLIPCANFFLRALADIYASLGQYVPVMCTHIWRIPLESGNVDPYG
jgi:hypothetical protein